MIGWGANQFAPLLLVYRSHDHLSETRLTAIFAAYVIGLIPALLIGGRLATRVGHRAILRPALVLGAISSLVLAFGEQQTALLFVGRILYGVTMGMAMAPATTWVKELSTGRPAGTGARRAATALSAGFCGGPLASGCLAEWLPAPAVLPYAVHIVLITTIGALLWNAPESPQQRGVPSAAAASESTPDANRQAAEGPRHTALTWHFWLRVAPMAPWVFTCASVSFVILPTLMSASAGSFAIAFTGMMAGATLGVGVLVQQPARSIEARHPGTATALGMVAATVGVLLVVVIVGHRSIALTVVTVVVLGCGYGLNLVGGLTRIEHAAPPGDLALTNGVFYSLSYLGFFVPTVVSVLVGHWPEQVVLLGLAAVAAVTLVVAVAGQRAARVIRH